MTSVPRLFLDNRINVSDMSHSIVRISGEQINYFRITPDGSAFQNQIIFNNVITPNLSNTLVGKNIRLRYQVQVAGTADLLLPKPATTIGQQVNGTLRAYPLQSICDNIQLVVNGSTTSVTQRQVLTALQRCQKPSLKVGTESEAPTQADNLAVLSPSGGTYSAFQSQQVLSSYVNSDGTTRGSFVASAFAANVYTFDVVESLMLSPLTSETDDVALPNINTLSLQLNYSNTADMCVWASVAGAQAVIPASFTGVTIVNPVLELTYFSVSPHLVAIPRMYQTAYENIVYFPKALGTNVPTNAASAFQVQSDTLRFTSCPSMIYIMARPQMQLRSASTAAGQASIADFCFPLGANVGDGGLGYSTPSINVTYGNRSGLFSSLSLQQAYKMSYKNGVKLTFKEWYNAGCVLAISPTLDIGYSQSGDVLPGMTGSVNFQFQATYNNSNALLANAYAGSNAALYNAAAIPSELVIVVSYAGAVIITPDNAVFSTGILSEAEVDALLKQAPKTGEMMSDQVLQPTVQGAGLFSKMKSIVGAVAKGVGAIAPHLETASRVAGHPLVKKLAGGVMTSA